MIPDPALAWSLTVLFVATGVVSAVALARSRSWPDRGSYLAHVLMSVSMAIMPWSWSMSVPPLLQIIVFTVAALWYVGLAVFRPSIHAGPEAGGHHSGPVLLGYHAAMMAAMVWMSALMTMMMGGSTGMQDHGSMSMPGMSMPGTSMSGTSMSGTSMSGASPSGTGMAAVAMTGLWQQPAWAIVVTLAFVALFAVAAVWFLVDLVRVPGGGRGSAPLSPLVQTLLNLVMAIGMGASFLLMS